MKVAIVDYGMGNLHSVLKSVQAAQVLSKQNAEVYLTSQPEEVMAADKVIFPGQGAMPDCMSALKASGLGEAVSDGLKNIGFDIPQEKWFTNLHSKGNTGSASIYIILEEFMRTFPIEHGQKILCYVPESGRFSTCFMLLEAVKAV